MAPVRDRLPVPPALKQGNKAADAVQAGGAGVAVALQHLARDLDQPGDQVQQPGKLGQGALVKGLL